jgi:hypothetical protein
MSCCLLVCSVQAALSRFRHRVTPWQGSSTLLLLSCRLAGMAGTIASCWVQHSRRQPYRPTSEMRYRWGGAAAAALI